LFTKEHLKSTLDELNLKISSLTAKNNQLISQLHQAENSGGKGQKVQLEMKGRSLMEVRIRNLE
jgi:hypothetical protein